MERDELIQAAAQAIGQAAPDDYQVAPATHADLLAASAPALGRVLRRSEIIAVARQFENADQEAGEAKRVFRSAANRANCAVLATACLSALIVIAGPLATNWGKGLLIALGVIGILAGALGSMWLFKVKEGRLLENWMTARAAGETLRLRYFELITNAQDAPGSASAMPLALLQTEYFRRYQLDVQRNFYRTRRADHRRAAAKWLNMGAYAVALGSVAGGLAGLLGGAVDTRWVAIAGLGVVATALSSFAAASEALGQDRRNQESYGHALDAIEGLTGKLDEVRAAAAGNQPEPLHQFVAAVHEQLALEHRQWLGAAENTQASLAKIEEALTSARSKLLKPDTKGPGTVA